MKSIWQKTLWLIAFSLAFFVVKYAKEGYMAHAIEDANVKLESVKQEAVAKRPDLAPSVAFAEAAKHNSEASLTAAGGSDKKISMAADQFVGFYYVNVKTRYEYCNKLGVDITPFVTAFKAVNAEEYRITIEEEIRQKVNIEWSISKLEPSWQSIINQAMQDASKQYKVSTKEVCEIFANNSSEIAAEMTLQKVNPALYAALHGH